MLKINEDKITISDDCKQIFELMTDGNGDYYFTLFSNYETRLGDYYTFIIDEQHPTYNYFNKFIEQEKYLSEDSRTPYFIVNNNSIKIADQNSTLMESEFIRINSLENKIKIEFSEKFPASIRVNGVGRLDYYPFFIPVIDLFNNLRNINFKNIILGTGCYENIKSGNTVSITGDGGNAWGYFGPAYKKLAPSWKLYEYWRDNPDSLSEEDLIDHYIQEYYKHRLENLDVSILLTTLKEKFGEKIILLCHELPGTEIAKNTFCHRRVVADYIELESGITIPEIMINNQGENVIFEQRDYKLKLKQLIKNRK